MLTSSSMLFLQILQIGSGEPFGNEGCELDDDDEKEEEDEEEEEDWEDEGGWEPSLENQPRYEHT